MSKYVFISWIVLNIIFLFFVCVGVGGSYNGYYN